MAFNFLLGAAILVALILFWSFRILREYERGVVFQLGRFWAVKGPGLFILIPVVQQMVKIHPQRPQRRLGGLKRPVPGWVLPYS